MRRLTIHFVLAVRDKLIEDLLNESEIEDFAPSDEDVGDPEFQPAASMSEFYTTESSEDESDTPNEPVGPVVGRGRGRGQGRGRGRGAARNRRGRGRGMRRGRQGHDRDENVGDSPSSSGTVSSGNWTVKEFNPRFPKLMQPAYLVVDTEGFSKTDYLKQYIDDEFIDLIVRNTNQTAIEKSGRSLYLTSDELYVYLGITFLMAAINYPNLRMYWEKKWRVAVIANNMSRNRFFLLRNSLKVVFDTDVPPETRAKDKLWKMRPLIDRIQAGCNRQDKDQCLSLDEMIIPFTGSCAVKQYCPGKPNPVGLKAFVLANPDGTVCDFHVYQGQTTYPNYEDTNFGLGEKAVLTLSEDLVPGHVIYFDRYFTSEKLLDELEKKGIKGTGTVMKNRIPADVRPLLVDDRELKDQGRGSSQVIVRKDDQIAFTKWYDNKPVLFLSSVEANEEADVCQRWCKKNKVYLTVPRPRVVRQYNQKMGGVDLADRLLAVCPYRYRTRKWTQRFLSSLIDLAVANSWLQYKKDQLKSLVPLKKIQQLRGFKMEIGETFIEAYAYTDTEPSTDVEGESENQPPPKRRGNKIIVPVPNKKFRTAGAKHLPFVSEKVGRCRHCHYNRTLFKCRACDVNLCLTKARNCYSDFHNDE